MKKLIIILGLCLGMFACSPIQKIVEVPVEVVKTEYIKQVVYDSIYIKDSTDRYRSNDTVFYTKYLYKYIYTLKNDTVHITDSIPVVLKETTQIEVNKLKWWQKTLMYIGLAFIVIVIIKIIMKFK